MEIGGASTVLADGIRQQQAMGARRLQETIALNPHRPTGVFPRVATC
jgi:hypothetical protein